jgi:deoxyadenosine/deoxycytidine kinase
MEHRFIAIEGCIGAGKTELAKRLSLEFKVPLLLERFADNPFLSKFYSDPIHYSFPVELAFLEDRYRQMDDLKREGFFEQKLIFSDYFIDKCLIFAKNNLQYDEFNLYRAIFKIIASLLPKPDLILYLHKSPKTLLQNIHKRGREYEMNIKEEYLDCVQKQYESYFDNYSDSQVFFIDSTNLNFMDNEEDFQYITSFLK